MLKQVTVTLDTSDALQAQWLVEYLASPDRARFGRACLLLGFLAATGHASAGSTVPSSRTGGDAPSGQAAPRRGSGVGAGLFGLE